MQVPLTLGEAQAIAESIVGGVQWRGSEGYCPCPGIEKHTTPNSETDCKVVVEPIDTGQGTLAPGVYCFHSSCERELEEVSYRLRSVLGQRQPSCGRQAVSPSFLPRRPARPEFDPAKLEHIASKLGGIDAGWFAARSKKRVDNRAPASFLHELYRPGERVVVFDVFESQGQAVWTHHTPPFNADELDAFRTEKPHGVWFLSNPVSGEYVPDDERNKDGTPHLTRRSWRTVTAWRYLVLESDKANPAHWLATLAQMPLPIAAIYTSGGRSIHALVKIDAESKMAWDTEADKIKPALVTLGACGKTISAVRLTRLPGCERVEKKQVQTLLFLNGQPDETPIADLPIIAAGWTDPHPADLDGFDGKEADQ